VACDLFCVDHGHASSALSATLSTFQLQQAFVTETLVDDQRGTAMIIESTDQANHDDEMMMRKKTVYDSP